MSCFLTVLGNYYAYYEFDVFPLSLTRTKQRYYTHDTSRIPNYLTEIILFDDIASILYLQKKPMSPKIPSSLEAGHRVRLKHQVTQYILNCTCIK